MWENDLAREFKKRNNKPVIGPCIGIVQSVSPLKASIYDGQIMIDNSNGYICNHLLERKSKMELSGTNTQSGNLSASCSYGSHGSYSANGNISINGDIHLKEVLKAGDMVLVVPSGDEQKFFIVDILKGVS